MQVCNYSFQCFLTCCFAAHQSAQGFLCCVRMCACCLSVCMIKRTCAVNWIIVRERRAESISLSRPDLAGSRGKTVSRHLELSPDAVDDLDFCCALSCSLCSTTCCCIAIGLLNHSNDFLHPSCRSRLYITGSRYAGFCLEFNS